MENGSRELILLVEYTMDLGEIKLYNVEEIVENGKTKMAVEMEHVPSLMSSGVKALDIRTKEEFEDSSSAGGQYSFPHRGPVWERIYGQIRTQG